MTRLDLARINFADVLLAWLEGDVGFYQLDSAAAGYRNARNQ